MVLYGAARRSRVRRIVLLAHTFGYAVLLGVIAWAVDASALRGFLVGAGALMFWYSMSSWRGLRRSLTEASTLWEMFVYLFSSCGMCSLRPLVSWSRSCCRVLRRGRGRSCCCSCGMGWGLC